MTDRPTPPPRLVLVHGIGAPPRPETARQAWVDDLALGMEQAGHLATAQDLRAGRIDIRFAHYAPFFSRSGAQGADGAADEDEAELLAALADELLNGLEDGGGLDAPSEVGRLERARAQLHPVGQPQGGGAVLRRAIDALTTLAGLPVLQGAAAGVSDRLAVGQLRQVTRYLRRGEQDAEDGRTLDERIRDVVLTALGDGPAVVVAHSLGTIVALESLIATTAAVPLFVTCGSPLGMRALVLPRLHPRPPATPPAVAAWLNVWDHDDPVVARPDIAADFAQNVKGVRPVSRRADAAGSWVHPATSYLRQSAVGGPVAAALEGRPPL